MDIHRSYFYYTEKKDDSEVEQSIREAAEFGDGFWKSSRDFVVTATPEPQEGVQSIQTDALREAQQVEETASCRVLSSNLFESVNQINVFLSIGVASLIHHRIDNRECHSIIDNSEGQNIDVRIVVLLVCPIHRKIVGSFDWN